VRTTHTTKAELEFLQRLPRTRCTSGVRGQVLYLPRTGHTVVPFERHADRWLCIVVADPARPYHTPDLWVHDAEIETSLGVATVDPITDPETFAHAWQARLWPRWPGGAMPALAQDIAQNVRQAGSVTVELDEDGALRLAQRNGITLDDLHRALTNLIRGGLLSHSRPVGRWGEFTLTIPGTEPPPEPEVAPPPLPAPRTGSSDEQ
jgi:hypothetical protein